MMLDESANMWLMIAEHVAPDLKVDYCKAAHMIPSLPPSPSPLFSSPPLLCRVMTAKCSIHVMGVGGGGAMYKCKRPVMTKHKRVVAISYFTVVKGALMTLTSMVFYVGW